MMTTQKSHYRPTESKYKGVASEMYVTYELEQKTRGGGSARLPKVKRVYIAGDFTGWELGEFRKRSGREVHGVYKIPPDTHTLSEGVPLPRR
jgi:hypothetical protein